jgi:hypothetical protein
MSIEKHQQNCSPTKQAYSFGRSKRPSQKPSNYTFYDLPGTRSKRTCSFGRGQKQSLVLRCEGPPPGTYNVPGFVEMLAKRSISFGVSRDKVVGGPLPRRKSMDPGPGEYPLGSTVTRKNNGYIGRRINSLKRMATPGPGEYNPSETVLSTSKNTGCPSLKSRVKTAQPFECPGPGAYNPGGTINGTGRYSVYKGCLVRSFARETRPSMENLTGSGLLGPGTYPVFSEFG